MDPAAPDQGEVEMAVPPEPRTKSATLAQQIAIFGQYADVYDQNAQIELKQEKRAIVDRFTQIFQAPGPLNAEMLSGLIPLLKALESNIFRPPPPPECAAPPDELPAEPVTYRFPVWWTEMQLVYNLFIEVIIHGSTPMDVLRGMFDARFLARFLELFSAPHENTCSHIQNILNRLYARNVSRRRMARALMLDFLMRFAHEGDFQLPGCSQLLGILCGIVGGFTTPLREEHCLTFRMQILPLHKTHSYPEYHDILSRCSDVFVIKKPALGVDLLRYLLRRWPNQNSLKQTLFLERIRLLIPKIDMSREKLLARKLFLQIAQSFSSPNSRVAKQASVLFELPDFANLIRKHKDIAFPILAPVVEHLTTQVYWSVLFAVHFESARQTLCDIDATEFEKCVADKSSAGYALVDCETSSAFRDSRERIWSDLTERAQQRIPGVWDEGIPKLDRVNHCS